MFMDALENDVCIKAFKEHESLQQRFTAMLFLWAMRTRHTKVRLAYMSSSQSLSFLFSSPALFLS